MLYKYIYAGGMQRCHRPNVTDFKTIPTYVFKEALTSDVYKSGAKYQAMLFKSQIWKPTIK